LAVGSGLSGTRIDGVVSTLTAEIEGAAAGTVLAATWTALSALNGTRAGQPAEVPVTDTGSHTDPVVGGSAFNSGKFAWSTSPAGWRRVGPVADPTAVTAAIDLTQVAMRTGTYSTSGSTVTLTWTQARGVWNGAVITINDLPSTVLLSTETLYVDLIGGSSPYTAAKAAISPALRADFATGKKIQLLYNQAGTLIGPFADILLHDARSRLATIEDKTSWDPDELVIEILTTGRFNVYQKAGPQSSNAYARFRVDRNLVPDSDPGEGRASDVWRINGVYSYLRTGRWTFEYVRRLCTEGEFETAILVAGKSDYMGGRAHGDEKKTREYLRLDGRNVVLIPGAADYVRCRTIELIQETTLYLPDTTPVASTPVATVVRRHIWKDGEFRLCNFVTFNAVLTLNQSFLAMLPVEREDYQNPGFLITSGAQRSPHFFSEDVSAPGFPMTESKASLYKLSGSNGYAFEVEILKGWTSPNRRSWISNPEAYNKVYFDVFGAGYVTSIGEQIETETRYRFMSL
jgi:hypothetical protein